MHINTWFSSGCIAWQQDRKISEVEYYSGTLVASCISGIVFHWEDKMNRIENISKVYTQSPWRKQVQYLTMIVMGLIAIALVAYIFLSVSAHATAVGRDIQDKRSKIKELDREIEDMEAELAIILSSEQMEARAKSLGFREAEPDQVVYMTVPGYIERQPAKLAPYSRKLTLSVKSVPFEYTETLFDWIKRQFDWISFSMSGVRQ